jgi:2-C-methyl-D-erythritol 4-phosphate cytidylyltransferase
LKQALQEAARTGFHGTDEATLVERIGHPVFVVPGDHRNFKVTWREDLERAVCPEESESR